MRFQPILPRISFNSVYIVQHTFCSLVWLHTLLNFRKTRHQRTRCNLPLPDKTPALLFDFINCTTNTSVGLVSSLRCHLPNILCYTARPIPSCGKSPAKSSAMRPNVVWLSGALLPFGSASSACGRAKLKSWRCAKRRQTLRFFGGVRFVSALRPCGRAEYRLEVSSRQQPNHRNCRRFKDTRLAIRAIVYRAAQYLYGVECMARGEWRIIQTWFARPASQ